MKKAIVLGLLVAPVISFAGGYGLINPVKIESAPVKVSITEKETKSVSPKTTVSRPRLSDLIASYCANNRESRWFDCDTKSEINNRRYLRIEDERFSDAVTPAVKNRSTRGEDLEREFDRQAAARNKLQRYLNAYGR